MGELIVAAEDRYQVFTARDDIKNLSEVLQYIATVKGHIGIVSVTWQPQRPGREGGTLEAGYTIIAEIEC